MLHDGFTTLSSGSTSPGLPYTSGQSWILINNGNGFVQVPVNGSLAGFNRLVATGDFDGDGLTDIALEGASNVTTGSLLSWGTYIRQDGRILFGNGGIPNRLTSIKSQTGAVTTIAYAPSSDFGTNQMPGIQQVVKSITTDDGRGGVSTVEHRYVGGRYDFIARQTLGYKTVTAYLPPLAGETEGPQVVTTYLNDHLAEYGLIKSRVVIQGGVTLSREIFDYTIEKTGNGPWRADRTGERKATLYGSSLVETTTTRAFDAFGQIIRETNLGFTTGGTNLDPSDDVTTTMGYVPNLTAYIVDRPNFRREEAGIATTAALTDDLSYAAMSYDGAAANTNAPINGNLTKVEEWTGTTASLTLRTAKLLTYDAWGNVLTETDARAAASGTGPTASYTYDTARRLFRLSTTNALGQVETVAWNTLCQAPATITDLNLRVTTKTYDTFCRETRTDLPGGQYQITRYVSFGLPTQQYVERETKSGSSTPGRDLSISREYFDGLARSWAKVQPGTTSAVADGILLLSAYDARSNLAWTSLPLPFANLNTTPNAAQRTSFTYDGLDRPLDTLLPDGAKRSAAYLTVSLSQYGGPVLAYPATRSQDEHCFDATAANTICGEAIQITDAAGRLIRSDRNDTALSDLDAGGAALRSTSYRYDRKGSLTQVTDPGGITFAYTYDVFGNRLTADDPGLGFWTLTYDANNNLLTQTDAK
ncbi:MAG: toxin TcdB middle/N-terminal domain-containing protein, partial [Paracoccaceae bacterium]